MKVEEEKKITNRWICLIAAMTLALFSGLGYAWSVYQIPLMNLLNSDLKTVSLAFTINVAVSTMAPIFLGRLQMFLGIPRFLRLGIAIYTVGLFTSIWVSSPFLLYLTFGILVGIGLAMIYPCLMTYGASLFPERTGLAAGLIASTYGFGTFIWAPFSTFLMEKMSVLWTLATLGIIFFLIMMPVSFLIKSVPKKPISIDENTNVQISPSSPRDYTWQEMLRSYRYYILLFTMILATTAGLMVTGHASGILQENIGLSPASAAFFVGMFSISNTAGRLIFGPLSDFIGRYQTMMIEFALVCSAMLMLYFLDGNFFILAMFMVSACHGGFAAILSPVCADNFGLKNHAVNYTFLFIAYGFSGIIGPQLGARIRDITGNYDYGFLTVAVLAVIGFSLVLFLQLKKQRSS